MSKLILTVLAIGFMATAHASGGNVTVTPSTGTYTVGTQKKGFLNFFTDSLSFEKNQNIKSDFNKPIRNRKR